MNCEFTCVNNVRDDKLLKIFGRHLQKLRIEKGLSQEGLANEANVPISQIGRIERGEVNVTLSTLSVISRALQLELKSLMEFKQ